jgi:hypothetical protein
MNMIGIGIFLLGFVVISMGIFDLQRGNQSGRLRVLTGLVILVSGIYLFVVS